MVKCAGCETELKETDANARRPCPVCGDTKRVFDDSITLDARVLEIQVVRAVVDAAWWRSLARRKAEQVSGTAEQLSDLLMKAVNMKAKYLPPRQRARLVLAIDANRFAGFTLDAVVSATRRK